MAAEGGERMRGASGRVAMRRRNISPSSGSPAAGLTPGSATASSATRGRVEPGWVGVPLPYGRGSDWVYFSVAHPAEKSKLEAECQFVT